MIRMYLFLNSLVLYSMLSVNIDSCAKKQNAEFEGEITFENTIKVGKEVERDSFYYNSFDKLETLFYSKGNYMIEFPNGQKFTKVLYNNESNKYYTFFKNKEIEYQNCSEESDIIVKVIRNNKVEPICGYNCESIKFDFGRFSMTYFYSRALPVKEEYFKNHLYQYRNRLFKETQSLYLKTIMEFEDMSFTSTAIKIDRHQIDKDRFAIPMQVKKRKD
jgi:hypothetical protein